MAKKFNLKLKEGNWIDWEDGCKLRLRPFPASQTMMTEKDFDMDFSVKMFKICVVDWEGFVDDDDKPIECNDETKQYMFDYYPELINFVLENVNKLMNVGDKELKN